MTWSDKHSGQRASLAPGPALPPLWWQALLLLWLALGCLGIALEHGYAGPVILGEPLPTLTPGLIHLAQFALLLLYWGQRAAGRWLLRDSGQQRWSEFDSALAAVLLLAIVWHALLGGVAWRVVEIALAMLLLAQTWRLNVQLAHRLPHPGLLFPLSFVLLIALGTLLIKLPRATPTAQPINWLDALFTMTSAVCVTGLTVRSTAAGFTPFGQFLIALFIQLGALGILIFGSTLALVLGRSLSLRENVTLSRMLQDQPLHRLSRFAIFIVVATLVIELIGAAILYPLWQSDGAPLTALQRFGYSAFHAISAFCNAGFDITGQSLTGYRYTALAHGVIAPLIVLGGLGFPVLDNLFRVSRDRLGRWLRRRPAQGREPGRMPGRLTLHTKLVLTTTAGVYLLSVITLGLGQLQPYMFEAAGVGQTAHVERPGPLNGQRLGQFAADSSFMAVTARTAGFNTVPMSELGTAERLSLMTQMVIGGSPGSAAGGARTIVLALLGLSIVGTLRPGKETEAFGRAIPDHLVRQAVTILAFFFALILFSTFLIALAESYPFEKILFEVTSAASTTGLSLGISQDPKLFPFSKWVLVGTMLLGRVGPLTLLGMVLLRQRPRAAYSYPHEPVALG
jgi:trk system potassium uptake protein TrkH